MSNPIKNHQQPIFARMGLRVMLILALLLALNLPMASSALAGTIPTFSIQSVARDSSVTIQTYNYPANQVFTVRMGAYGTLGIGGIVVGTFNSGAGGSFTLTFNIPSALKGSYRIAIRADSSQGYYSFNWFYNNTTGGATGSPYPGPIYTGIPIFNIFSVVRDQTVTIQTYNYPVNQVFTVRMGAYGTLGIGGIPVATINSGAGGSFQATFNIPDALKGMNRIAIRADSPQGYYSYNWFWNFSTAVTTSTDAAPAPTPVGETLGPAPASTPVPAPAATKAPDAAPKAAAIPSLTIISVAPDSSVVVKASNFPPNTTVIVRMGAYGTQAIGGVVVGTTQSVAGTFEADYTIPNILKGSNQIAIRIDDPAGYYAFGWFYNK